MAARTIPVLAAWTSGARVTGVRLANMVSYMQFWADPPMFRMHQAAVQSFANATFTQFIMDSIVGDYDTDSGRSGSTPYSYTIPAGMSGRWLFSYKVSYATNGTGVRVGQIEQNGVTVGQTQKFETPQGAFPAQVAWSGELVVAAGDVMSVWGYQSTGGALNTDASVTPFFSGQLVSLASP